MKTRDRILDTALDLFNQSGTGAVSTNHIAEALGISPGNLYYHFRNKEAIIRALSERLFDAWDALYTLPDDRTPTPDDLLHLVRQNFVVLAQYRFLYRELLALLRRDPELQQRWIEVRARGLAGFHELFAAFRAAGVLQTPVPPASIERLAELCWLVSEFWLPSVELRGATLSDAELAHGVDLLLQVLAPYIRR